MESSHASSASVRKARRREWWKKKKTDLRNNRDKKSTGKTTSVRRNRKVEKNTVTSDPKRGFRSTLAVPKVHQKSQEIKLSSKVESSESDSEWSDEDHSELAQKLTAEEKDEKSKVKVSTEQPKKVAGKSKKKARESKEEAGKSKKVAGEMKEKVRELREVGGKSKEKAGESKEESGEEVGDRGKQKRYILFLGNLPHEASHDDILGHFSKRGVPITDLRLLTDRESGKPKGCAFAEFSSCKAMQNAIKFHRSKLQGRTINVEVTCGGGGKGEKRQQKIRERNRTMRRTNTVKSGKVIKGNKNKKAGNTK